MKIVRQETFAEREQYPVLASASWVAHLGRVEMGGALSLRTLRSASAFESHIPDSKLISRASTIVDIFNGPRQALESPTSLNSQP